MPPTAPNHLDDNRSFLAANMGIQFPQPPREVKARVGAPVQVYLSAVEVLSIDALGAYCLMEPRARTGQGLDLQWLITQFDGDSERAHSTLNELFDSGLLLTQDEAEQQRQEWAQLIDGDRPERPKLVAPDPWPRYRNENWSGLKSDLSNVGIFPSSGCVVYFLKADSKVVYVGSSKHPRSRIRAHRNTPWDRFEAKACDDRESAYWLEAAEILRLRPPLNSDYYLGGRGPLVPKQALLAGSAGR
jgi:hypothetical protein